MKWFWKIYLLLILVLGYGQMLRKIFTDTGGFSSRYIAAVIATIIVLALIAKLRNVPIGQVWMWKVLFCVLLLGCGTAAAFSIYLGFSSVLVPAVLLSVGALVLLPALQQIFMYSYKSPSIWVSVQNK